jgi:uncharacterized protein YcfL
MKKILLILLLVVFLFGCESKEKNNLYYSPNTIRFIDSSNYVLTLYYDEQMLQKVEWTIVADSKEAADKFENYYKDSVDYILTRDENTIILEYSERLTDELFSGLTQEEIKVYLKSKGYTLIKE